MANLVASRRDLDNLYERGALFANDLLGWLASASLARESDEGQLYERLTLFAINISELNGLAVEAARACDELDVDTATTLLLDDRPRLLELVGADLAAFATWLAQRLPVEYKLPADVAALATHFDVAGALSRVRERAGGLGIDVIRALRPEANGEHGLSMTDLVLGEWWSQDHG